MSCISSHEGDCCDCCPTAKRIESLLASVTARVKELENHRNAIINQWADTKAERDRMKEALEKIVQLNEHPRSCRLGNEAGGNTCDCGISIAKSALDEKTEGKA